MSLIPESDLYLWNHARLKRAWRHLGAHPVDDGVRFAVWAPYAEEVRVTGDWNDWDPAPLALRGETGVWEGVIEHAEPGHLYKYELVDANGDVRRKSDPFGFRMELRPNTASQIWTLDGFGWSDDEWMQSRRERQSEDQPIRVYEVHLGSWRKGRTYEQLAGELVAYVQEMGFTHVEFLPITEFPYDGSWGYQVCGYYAPTSRYGTPEDLKALINALHRAGIGVLLDWVPAHFPKDDHGLARFDGTRLFEHEDPRRGLHKDWDTLIFNYERPEVRNFLWSSALYWCEEFHFDGIRVDAVASMLHRDYSREEGEWVPDVDGSNLDRSAIQFLQELNDLLHTEAPGTLTIAEESTAFPGRQPADGRGRARLRSQVEHGVDARLHRLPETRPRAPQAPPRPVDVRAVLRVQGEVHASPQPRRGRAHEGKPHQQDARRHVATAREPAPAARVPGGASR